MNSRHFLTLRNRVASSSEGTGGVCRACRQLRAGRAKHFHTQRRGRKAGRSSRPCDCSKIEVSCTWDWQGTSTQTSLRWTLAALAGRAGRLREPRLDLQILQEDTVRKSPTQRTPSAQRAQQGGSGSSNSGGGAGLGERLALQKRHQGPGTGG